MSSKITSRAACLAELTSNPKSFFNCPDLHGGSGSSESRVRCGDSLDPAGNPRETITLSEETGKPKTLRGSFAKASIFGGYGVSPHL